MSASQSTLGVLLIPNRGLSALRHEEVDRSRDTAACRFPANLSSPVCTNMGAKIRYKRTKHRTMNIFGHSDSRKTTAVAEPVT